MVGAFLVGVALGALAAVFALGLVRMAKDADKAREAAQRPDAAPGQCPTCNPDPWLEPTPHMLLRPDFEAVWQAIRRWDINVPTVYRGYCGASGNHVRVILDAIDQARVEGTPADRNALLREVLGDDVYRTTYTDDAWRRTLDLKGDADEVSVLVRAGTLRRLLDRVRGPRWRVPAVEDRASDQAAVDQL
jgi:hypothetical protein